MPAYFGGSTSERPLRRHNSASMEQSAKMYNASASSRDKVQKLPISAGNSPQHLTVISSSLTCETQGPNARPKRGKIPRQYAIFHNDQLTDGIRYKAIQSDKRQLSNMAGNSKPERFENQRPSHNLKMFKNDILHFER
nr:hypothetical protein HmN_000289400 [Hymenolepis microstoma]